MIHVTGHVYLWANNSNGQIKFTQAPSYFRRLSAVAQNHILVQQDLTTTMGILELEFIGGSLIISAEVDIIANGGDLILDSINETVTTWNGIKEYFQCSCIEIYFCLYKLLVRLYRNILVFIL